MAIVVVTGTSTGIGQATAVSLARAEHTVYATMRNPDASGPLLDHAGEHASRLRVRALDVDSDASVESCFAAIHAEGPVDALVNNAGVGGGGAVEETPLSEFQRHGPYSATKFAVEGLSEAMAQELSGTGVRVAVVEPGVIATPIFEKGDPDPPPTAYPHRARMMAFFGASLENPVSPFVVGDLIRDIIESDSTRLQYPVGPDAAPAIAFRESKTGEEWVRLGGLDADEWATEMQNGFGIDVRSYMAE
jgi:NAD(P)-dependent dehydrogenase (short-subunit alcohol dehydrogenase family)